MSVCSTTTAPTDTTVDKPYTGTSYLPTANAGRGTDGRLTDTALIGIYGGMISNGQLVNSASITASLSKVASNTHNAQDLLNASAQKDKATLDGMSTEYCYYYVRYKYTLDKLFTAVVATSAKSSVSDSDKGTITVFLTSAKTLNGKLNDLIQIMNYIAIQRAAEMGSENNTVNTLNENIKNSFSTIKAHADMLKKENSLVELRERMVEYTQEKNRSANSLLGLYGFLNLVAIGLLIHIYRS